MNRTQKQAKLLYEYLDALAKDPNAAPPDDLDEEMIAAAQLHIAGEQRRPSLQSADRKRMWQDVLSQSVQTLDTQSSDDSNYRREISMFDAKSLSPSTTTTTFPTVRISWIMIAAVLSLVLIGGVLLFNSGTDNNGGGILGAGSGQNQEETPTPVPSSTPMPTSTPIPATDGQPSPDSESLQATPMQPTVPPPPDQVILPADASGSDISLPAWQTEPEPIALGDTVEHTLDADQDRWVYVLANPTDTIVNAELTSFEHLSLQYRVLQRPQIGGSPSISGTGGGGGGAGGGGGPADEPNRFGMRVEVRADDIVWIFVEKVTSDAATYTLSVEEVETPVLEYGEPLTTDIELAGADQLFEFEGQRGDLVDIRIDADIDTRLTLETLDGTLLGTDDDSGPGLNPELYHVQLPEDGQYRVRLSAVGFLVSTSADQPELTVNVVRAEPLNLTKGQSLMVPIADKLPAQVLSYEGTAGESVTLSAEVFSAPGIISVEVVQDGETLAVGDILPAPNSTDGMSSGPTPSQTMTRTFEIPADGQVLVLINYGQQQDGSIRSGFAFGLDVRIE